jgi:hypothetical protein
MFARRRTLAFAARGGEESARAARWRRGLNLLGPVLIVGIGVLLFIEAW